MAEVETRRHLPWKAHRLRGVVTLDEIADVTKISKRFLEAIESGAYSELPGGLFTTSYIRQYAAIIGFDSGEILLDQSGCEGEQGNEAVVKKSYGRVYGFRWGKGLIAGLVEKG